MNAAGPARIRVEWRQTSSAAHSEPIIRQTFHTTATFAYRLQRRRLELLHGHRMRLPDTLAIFPDCAVGRELARARRIQYRHAGPGLGIAVSLVHPGLAGGV